MRQHGWDLSVIGALAAAGLLLGVGIAMAVYEEQVYSGQQVKSVREQAQILAASVSAAVVFDDRKAAQEYVNAVAVNPETEAAGVYDRQGRLLAGFARGGTRLPAQVRRAATTYGGDHVDVAEEVRQAGTRVGMVLLRAVSEPVQRRYARYAGLVLLVTMGALVIAVLSFSQAALARRARQLSEMNERLQAEMAERQRTEEALRQSQKMEAVGQLSGGIAHDFNNLIMIVKGNLRLLRRRLGAELGPQGGSYIVNAEEALDRAAHLTQRILAFSRRQPLTPQRVSLSHLVEGMGELLRHSVGEKVEIVTRLNAQWPVLCDVNQMENVILNLAINARDAMPEGGRLTIETSDMTLSSAPPEMEEFKPGAYVALTMRDTGHGMPEDVRRRAVDPFFTTKPQGKGTGLGLSMTFGYVRQSGGYLVIQSAPGEGTAMTILMPRDIGGEIA
ncbi:MAG: hybrid sensor histidine kinase/response regulator [Alphaproteobacteria bacterium]|nr:hybrid sensor histidine kinase/response regulator [Alphaproteobacteria bacterium]